MLLQKNRLNIKKYTTEQGIDAICNGDMKTFDKLYMKYLRPKGLQKK